MAEAKLKGILTGKTIDGWKLVKCLGAGGFGVAFHIEKGDKTAVMKLPLVAGSNASVDFAVEAATMEKIQDPANIEDRTSNICRLLGHGTADIPELKKENVPYLLMEFCESDVVEETKQFLLKNKNNGGADALGHVARLSAQILRAVWDLHQVGLLNRDIKNENCGYPAAWLTCKMYDFGMARRYLNPDGTYRLPRTNVCFRGTDEWCSFKAEYGYEQGRVDDLWAWHMATIEMTFCYSSAPQCWSFLNKEDESHEPEIVFRRLLKMSICPGDLCLPSAHANMFRIRFYLHSLGQFDHPDYFLLCQLTQEMKSRAKKRNKAATADPRDVVDQLRFFSNYFY